MRREAALTGTAEENATGPDWLYPDPVLLVDDKAAPASSDASSATADAAADAEADATTSASVRIGLVAMVRAPEGVDEATSDSFAASLQTFLRHHTALGVERFFLHLEDSAALHAQLGADTRVELTSASGTARDYFGQVDRQAAAVDAAVARARSAGLTHLLHIDCDELLYCSRGPGALRAALAAAPAAAADLHLHNLEALPPSASSRPDLFRGVTAFRHEPRRFCAYTNGKSFGRLASPGLRMAGPHRFRADAADAGATTATMDEGGSQQQHQLPAPVACVLHFESTTYALWQDKFASLATRHLSSSGDNGGQGDGRQQPRLPFAYYRESMEQAHRLLLAHAAEDSRAATKETVAALQLWCRWKRPPRGLPAPPAGPRDAPVVVAEHGITLLHPLGFTCDQEAWRPT